MHTILWILCAYWQLPESNYFNKDIISAPDYHCMSCMMHTCPSKEAKLFYNKRENKTLGPGSYFPIIWNNNINSKARAQYLVRNTLKMEEAAENFTLDWKEELQQLKLE